MKRDVKKFRIYIDKCIENLMNQKKYLVDENCDYGKEINEKLNVCVVLKRKAENENTFETDAIKMESITAKQYYSLIKTKEFDIEIAKKLKVRLDMVIYMLNKYIDGKY